MTGSTKTMSNHSFGFAVDITRHLILMLKEQAVQYGIMHHHIIK